MRMIDLDAIPENAYWCRDALAEALADAPTIEERKKGKWIDKWVISNYPEEGFNIYHLLVCDQCGCMHRATVWCVNGKYINADFCPNCGADMRGTP